MWPLDAVIEFGRELKDKFLLNPEPTKEQKLNLKTETKEIVSQAKSTLEDFIDKIDIEIAALAQMIRNANKILEDPNILRTGKFWINDNQRSNQ